MDISFRTSKLQKTFSAEAALQKAYGARVGKAVMRRMAVLRAARNLASVPTAPPERRHQLGGDRDEQFAVGLDRRYRLVFAPDHKPLLRMDDGGIDTGRVTAITIIEVVDYH